MCVNGLWTALAIKTQRKHTGNALGIEQLETHGVKDEHIMVITVKIGGNKPLRANEENTLGSV